MKVLDDDYAAHAKTLLNTPFTGDPATPYEIVRPEGYEPPPPKTDENGEPIPRKSSERSTSWRITCRLLTMKCPSYQRARGSATRRTR